MDIKINAVQLARFSLLSPVDQRVFAARHLREMRRQRANRAKRRLLGHKGDGGPRSQITPVVEALLRHMADPQQPLRDILRTVKAGSQRRTLHWLLKSELLLAENFVRPVPRLTWHAHSITVGCSPDFVICKNALKLGVKVYPARQAVAGNVIGPIVCDLMREAILESLMKPTVAANLFDGELTPRFADATGRAMYNAHPDIDFARHRVSWACERLQQLCQAIESQHVA